MPRQNPPDPWIDCAPGTLTELSRSLHRARRRKTVGRVGKLPQSGPRISGRAAFLEYGDKIMLVLSRKPGQCIVIGFGDDVATLTLLKIQGNRVQIGIEAPLSVGVHRQEVWARLVMEAASPGSGETEPGRAVA